MDLSKVIQQIQYILAPAVMVSASALLMLGFNNKFSNLASRFRVLNQEQQVLTQKAARSKEEQGRLSNLEEQVASLFRRSNHLRNAIYLTYASILCFTGTSILILIDTYYGIELHGAIIGVFALGLLGLFIMTIVMLLETCLFHRVLKLESRSWKS